MVMPKSDIVILGQPLRVTVATIWLLGGFNPTPLKNDGVSSSWDDNIPNIYIYLYIYTYGKKMLRTTNQISFAQIYGSNLGG